MLHNATLYTYFMPFGSVLQADLRFSTAHVVTLWGNQQAPPSVTYSAAAILMTVPATDSNGQRESPWGN